MNTSLVTDELANDSHENSEALFMFRSNCLRAGSVEVTKPVQTVFFILAVAKIKMQTAFDPMFLPVKPLSIIIVS